MIIRLLTFYLIHWVVSYVANLISDYNNCNDDSNYLLPSCWVVGKLLSNIYL